MNLIHSVIRAAHCSGTHHFLAIDALDHLENRHAKVWKTFFYHFIESYLSGSKAPDKVFKDYKNHVLHVRDGYWGGAGEACEEWYARLVYNLKTQNWQQAAFAAGVLSHYYADALHPFHTAQSEAENNIHSGVEWSISKIYPELKKTGAVHFAQLEINMPAGEGWLTRLVEENAGFANQYYEGLIAHYNFDVGVVAPEEGLDGHAKEMIAWILRYCSVSFAKVLDRAFEESGILPQSQKMTLKAVLAGLKIPYFRILSKLEDAKMRQLVEASYDELHATGTVDIHLAEDDRMVRELYEKEVQYSQNHWKRQKNSVQLISSGMHPEIYDTTGKKIHLLVNENLAHKNQIAHTKETVFCLKKSDPVVNAPYIGRKILKRMQILGIQSVGDFLKVSARDIARMVKLKNVSASDIRKWQEEISLMCEIPQMKAHHARLLREMGIASSKQLADISEKLLIATLVPVAQESGKRFSRRDKQPPVNSSRIRIWKQFARKMHKLEENTPHAQILQQKAA